MADLDWRRARKDRRALERRLPRGLRQIVGVVRRDDMGDAIAGTLLREASDIAAAREDGSVRYVPPQPGGPAQSYVLPVVERDILARGEADTAYRGGLRAKVRRTLRSLHLVRVDPGATVITLPRSLGPVPTLVDGVLHVESGLGLGTSSVLGSEPEGWDHWVASRIIRGWSPTSVNAPPAVNALVIGALAGGFARAVTAMGTQLPQLRVTELDWVLSEATNVPCVESRGVVAADARFDAVVVVLPPSARSEASGQRRIYDNKTGSDPGRLGPRRWLQAVAEIIERLGSLMNANASAYVLLPLGVRTRGGYVSAPELLAPVLAAILTGGFGLEALPTIEVAPVAQPFVARNRPRMITLILRRGAS